MRKRNRPKTTIPALALGAFFCVLSAAQSSWAIDILPHRVTYDMTLGKASRDSGISSIQGTLLLTWEDGCDAWVISQRLFLRIARDDLAFTTSSAFDTRESKDGLDFSFEDTTMHDPGGLEHASGSARLVAPGGDGSLVLNEPEAGQYLLPRGTIFPTAQMIEILARAEQGERFMSHLVYDGTDGANLFDVTTAVGEPFDKTVEEVAGGSVTIWPMRLAYYSHGSSEELPQVEIGADVQDNGVARRIVFDYGTFTVESTMTSIDALPPTDCPAD